MTGERVLVDAGPLVALLNVRDAAHAVCKQQARQLHLPLITTWLVLGEAAWLLKDTRHGVAGLLGLLDKGVVECPPLEADAPARMTSILRQYANLKPQLADASLLYLAERHAIKMIFTLDRRDFTVYRTLVGHALTLLP